MTITWMTFAIRLLVGFFLAVGIGIERQWLKTRAVLKTNVLVTLGSAMFVMLSIMIPGDASPTRVASQIVSGVGFLGGGVILRQGASIRGINTAATLWCAAAIGTLVGAGFLVQAYVSTVAVVGANLLLRPLVEAFKQKEELENVDQSSLNTNSEKAIAPTPKNDFKLLANNHYHSQYRYSCYLLCPSEVEAEALALLIKFAKEKNLMTIKMESRNISGSENPQEVEVEIKIDFVSQASSQTRIDSEEIILLLKTKTKVSYVNWNINELLVNTTG